MSFFNISWLLLLILFSILFDNKLVSGQCLTDQRDLLLQLNQSLSSYSFSHRDCGPIYWCNDIRPSSIILKRSSWSLNTDCCSAWVGVNCDKDGHVIGLDLSGERIVDGLDNSSSLFKLQHLQNLNLADNIYNVYQFRDIPSGFDRLANLTNLNLSNSGFTGQIPIEISRLTRLVSLDLSTPNLLNALKLDDPDLGALIRNLSELRVLRLDGVNISAEGRKWCQAVSSSLPKLQILSLSDCYLSGTIDKSLLQLRRSLNEIRLDGNDIDAQVPDFLVEFSNLTSLSLSYCGLYGKFPEKIFQLQTLRSLNLARNQLLHGSFPEFPQNGSLQKLVLMNTNFSGKIPNSIGNLKLLSYIDLGNCGFNGELPNSIGNLKLLSYLDLGNCGFNGSIPASMAKLDQLQYLDLSSNRFTGLLPSSSSGWSKSLTLITLANNRLIGPISLFGNKKFMKLLYLSLRNNSLNGSISPSLFTLPSLKTLDLSQNQFTGRLSEFPSETSQVDTLHLSSNKLEGPIPPSIFQLSSLKVLTLSSNKFNSTLNLDMFQRFRNLSSLDLSGNNFSIDTRVANPAMFPQLTTLNLRSCNLSVIPDFLRNQSSLDSLDLSSNQIRGKVPSWIWTTSLLITLNLSENCLEDFEQPLRAPLFNGQLAIVDLSSNMLQGKNLPLLSSYASFLDYSNNNFTNVIPHNISSYIPSIMFLSLSSNNLIGGIPISICECSALDVLDLSNNSLSGPIPPCLGTMTGLSVLNLGGNYFHGTIPHMFLEWCRIRTLSLKNNRLVGNVARSLANCTMLEVLDLGNNQINGTFPSWLGNMSNLRVLILRSNRFHGPLRHHQRTTDQNFHVLQIMDISSNNFTGNLSSKFFSDWKAMMIDKEDDRTRILRFVVIEPQLYYQDSVTVTSKGLYMELVKILPIFTSIDLSNNGFEGDIPEVLGRLSSLYILNISQNALTGGIPSSFGNLTQLESLDLSQNKLSGEIPMQLAGLTFLSSLNFSYNHLVGKIPLGTQIQSFNATSFEGNDGLCGPPLTKKCIDKGTEPPSPSKSVNEFNWMPVSVASGFGVGIGISICLMTFWGTTAQQRTRVRRSSRH